MPRALNCEKRASAIEENRRFYEALWSGCRLSRPESFNTWPLISSLVPGCPIRLEVGPGLRPRLPLKGTHFLDLSQTVVDRLRKGGGVATPGDATRLPFPDGFFDLVCAFDLLEHLEDDREALKELRRVLSFGGVLLVSVPLHGCLFSDFDRLVGHVRRYHPGNLLALFGEHGLTLQSSAPFGMEAAHPKLLRFGMRMLTTHPGQSLFVYNWLLLPLALLFQKRLAFSPGLVDTCRLSEIVLFLRAN
ncbi:class I SAM-dependent methyltransferase [Geomonas sp. Red32]|uniref:class I SAM-dependent methyltransferase n=1 Tax=Geomonas sp. Red32 TaxID=2912856 RepID=UPI00202CD8AD|nr:class I SAM-dependent methyltransferase [Geomonas sp. Red32]MCM0083078.1 class I SAM-dependent methyltransferase [Geomonas sp. Red32]